MGKCVHCDRNGKYFVNGNWYCEKHRIYADGDQDLEHSEGIGANQKPLEIDLGLKKV